MLKVFDEFKSELGIIENDPDCINNVILRGRHLLFSSEKTVKDELVMTDEITVRKIFGQIIVESESKDVNKQFQWTIRSLFKDNNFMVTYDDERFMCKKEMKIRDVPFIRYGYGVRWLSADKRTVEQATVIDIVKNEYPEMHKESESLINLIYRIDRDTVFKTKNFCIYDGKRYPQRIDIKVELV